MKSLRIALGIRNNHHIARNALGQSHCPEMRDLTMFDMGDPKISMFVECRK